jgi:hypothetical protein
MFPRLSKDQMGFTRTTKSRRLEALPGLNATRRDWLGPRRPNRLILGVRSMPLKDRCVTRRGLPRTVAQAAAKESWENRDRPNWRDRVDDLLKGKQILVKDLRQSNSIYVAAKRKGVHTLRFKVSDSKFAVVAEGIYDRKIEFIQAGNVYYTRKGELPGLFDAAQLDHNGIEDFRATGGLRCVPFFLALKAEALHLVDRTFEALEAIREAEGLLPSPPALGWFKSMPPLLRPIKVRCP